MSRLKKALLIIFMVAFIIMLGQVKALAANEFGIELQTDSITIQQGQTEKTFYVVLTNYNPIDKDEESFIPTLGYEAVLEYDKNVIESIAISSLNGWGDIEYYEGTGKILATTKNAAANTQIAKITINLKKDLNVENTTITLKNMVLSDGKSTITLNPSITYNFQRDTEGSEENDNQAGSGSEEQSGNDNQAGSESEEQGGNDNQAGSGSEEQGENDNQAGSGSEEQGSDPTTQNENQGNNNGQTDQSGTNSDKTAGTNNQENDNAGTMNNSNTGNAETTNNNNTGNAETTSNDNTGSEDNEQQSKTQEQIKVETATDRTTAENTIPQTGGEHTTIFAIILILIMATIFYIQYKHITRKIKGL